MTDNKDDKTLSVAGKKTLTLKPTGMSQGTVRQDMGRGRTKAVVVETVKRRPTRPLDEKPAITPAPAVAAAPAPRPAEPVAPQPAPVAAPAPAAPVAAAPAPQPQAPRPPQPASPAPRAHQPAPQGQRPAQQGQRSGQQPSHQQRSGSNSQQNRPYNNAPQRQQQRPNVLHDLSAGEMEARRRA